MKKVIITKKLYAEIHKWENLYGMSNPNVMRLLKLYTGMGVNYLLNKDGKILCYNFNKLATVMRSHSPKRIIEMAVRSGSFCYEKCNDANMNIYGITWIASPLCLSDKVLPGRSVGTPTDNLPVGDNMDIINNIYTGHSACTPNGVGKTAVAAVEHPHGEFEYCITGCTQRLYDICGAAAPIPAGAPDRPSGTARWNKFLKRWITENTEI